jgi:hypothetical protein
MATAVINLGLEAATVLIPEVVAIYKAIAALRQKGVSAADVTATVQGLITNIGVLDADTLSTLNQIK